jgi:hypothetical protein
LIRLNGGGGMRETSFPGRFASAREGNSAISCGPSQRECLLLRWIFVLCEK